ncbi:MAG: hypothetical protein AAF449_15090, partial [Myxococcota bacterium]
LTPPLEAMMTRRKRSANSWAGPKGALHAAIIRARHRIIEPFSMALRPPTKRPTAINEDEMQVVRCSDARLALC